MQIIISPAKQMQTKDDFDFEFTTPILLKQKDELLKHIQSLSYEELKKALKCSDMLALNAYELFQNHDKLPSTCAILAYNGIQYQYMHPGVFDDGQYQFLQDHLWILSGFYGILRPFDEIKPYRLEMMTKLPFSLYTFWKDSIAKCIPDEPILNLASEEYGKCVRKYRDVVDVRFCQEHKGKLVEKGVYAKMARGAMVRYITENKIEDIELCKQFKEFNYIYSEENSTDSCFTFIQQKAE